MKGQLAYHQDKKKFLEGLRSLDEKEKLQICDSGLLMRSLFAKKVRDNVYGFENQDHACDDLQESQEVSEGEREIPCSFAIRIEIGLNSVRNIEQHLFSNPHAPIPPIIFATSRGPICRRSTRIR